MNFVLLQAAGSSIDFGIIFYVMIVFLIINFVILVPKQKKKEKAQLNFIAELPKGSKIVSLGGLHGTVVQNEETTLIVEIATGVKVKIEKTSISYELTKKLNEVPAV